MAGNVFEWAWDRYGTYPGTVTDPLGATSGSFRVPRGGSWYDYARFVRAANRFFDSPDVRYSLLGFRLARSRP
jgi:formylglycine-generating enzyme required for sulfatase activity